MKKNVLALSIAAMVGGLGFAGVASAAVIGGLNTSGDAKTAAAASQLLQATTGGLTLAQGGVGHALVVPYFNAQNGNATVLHLTNTDTVNGKAVKIRFRSAANSDDLLDFQIYLSPGDVWTGAVSANGAEGASLVSADNTCTVPALTKNVAVPFGTRRLAPGLTDAEKANQTREGYVEIFNMADITSATAWNADGVANSTGNRVSPLYTATKHVNAVAPCSVAGSAARSLVDTVAVTNFTEATAAQAGLQTPTSGLMADWYILNVAQTTTFSGAATAIQATGRGNFVHFPQVNNEAVGVSANDTTSDPLFRTANVFGQDGKAITTAALTMNYSDLPDMSTPYTGGVTDPRVQAINLTTALAATSVTNQYATDAIISAKTDWVFSMPTRRYNVVANYAVANSNVAYRLFTNLTQTAGGNAVQAGNWFYPAGGTAGTAQVGASNGAYKANGNTSVDSKGNICVLADGQKFWDREETTSGVIPEFSPGGTTSVQFCGEVSVLAFKDAGNSVLGASVARTTATSGTYENGWGVLTTTNSGLGLPLIGSAFIKLENPSARAGMSGTYGVTWPHRYTRVAP
ncbi:cell surface protein [Delftia sp. JD2]|uniref:cell surface protein n=1 Tax=Delftia sp. JD2 TaxID=469553 RepID=UPI000806A65A|nr:cell surface protein [Delftia sp. JD2]OBY86916.1 cell surface protein [Delftia sp. JD2]